MHVQSFKCYSSNTAIGSDVPEEVIQTFPLEKIRQNGPLLQPGVQCRICLHGYQLGQFVRKLPRCKHKVELNGFICDYVSLPLGESDCFGLVHVCVWLSSFP